jgi:hypothetical protein
MSQDFAKFDSSRSKVQYTDERNHFDLYIVDYKSLLGFLQNPQVNEVNSIPTSSSISSIINHKRLKINL